MKMVPRVQTAEGISVAPITRVGVALFNFKGFVGRRCREG